MLSVIGMLRFAMGIPENIVMASDSYEVKETQIDYSRTISKSLLSHEYDPDTQKLLLNMRNEKVIKELPFDRKKEMGQPFLPEERPDKVKQIKE
jgi:hypothetical protein